MWGRLLVFAMALLTSEEFASGLLRNSPRKQKEKPPLDHGTPKDSYQERYCKDMLTTGGPLGNVQCCSESSLGFVPPSGIKCLPLAIIAGAQKAGTTVLSAILAKHPHINFSIKKELHFFDISSKYERGIRGYLSGFAPLTARQQGEVGLSTKTTFNAANILPNGFSSLLKHVNKISSGKDGAIVNRTDISGAVPINMESTPFYIASAEACQRMAETIPNVRLILLLREPVSRAYSEYNMKKRRVENQVMFLSTIKDDAVTEHLYQCLLPAKTEKRALKRNEIEKCLFIRAAAENNTQVTDKINDLMQMVTWRKVLRAFEIKAKKNEKNWLSSCFRMTSGKTLPRRLDESNTSVHSSMFAVLREVPHVGQSAEFLQHSSRARPHDNNYTPPILINKNLEVNRFDLDKTIAQDSNSTWRRRLQVAERTDVQKVIAKRWFDFEKCTDRHLERVRKISEFLDEKNKFNECAQNKLPGLELKTAADFERAVAACYTPSSGISGQYLYRSMFAAQIKRCSHHIPMNHMLIISNEDLKANLTSVMKRVTSFLGVPLHFDSNELQKLANDKNIVESLFPSMITSGWTQTSDYDPMPDDIRQELEQFFKPMNKALFELIGTHYDHW